MKIEIAKSSAEDYRGQSVVVISHKDRPRLEWDISIYNKSRSQVEDEQGPLFEELNAVLATLPSERQDRIYDVYRFAREEQSKGFEMQPLTQVLQRVAKDLYELVTYDDARRWVDTQSGLRVPDGIKSILGPEDPRDPLYLDRTYLEEDYKGLVAMGVAVRAMLPIWGEFLKTAKDYSGNANKEREGMRLLYFSSLINCEPMKRLERYIETTTREFQKRGPTAASIMGGAGSTATPEIIQAITVVRRLAVCDLISRDGSVNVITNVYQFILYNLKGMDRKYGGKYGANITDQADASTSREDSNDSRLELLRIKENVAAAVGVKKNVYSENIANMVEFVDPTIPREYLVLTARAIEPVDYKLYRPIQEFLMQAVLGSCIAREHPTMSPHGLPLMKLAAQHRAAIVVQSALWHWGFYQLAALLTAEEIQQPAEILGSADPMRYNKQSTELLSQLFPYERQLPRSRTKSRYSNVGQRVIENFNIEARRPIWRLHAPKALVDMLPNPQAAENYEFISTVRDEMIQLFLKINSQ